MSRNALIRKAILFYLENKLPDGWRIYAPREPDDYFLLIKNLDGKGLQLGVPITIDSEKPENAAQIALHSAWGVHEQGYEVWL